MIKALIDTNIIIDIALVREPFHTDAATIFQKIDDKQLQGYISASTATDIFYLLQKEKGRIGAGKYLRELIKVIDVLAVNRNTIIDALSLDWKDFEDAVQAQVSIENKLDMIITRNIQDYRNLTTLQVLTPRDFIELV